MMNETHCAKCDAPFLDEPKMVDGREQGFIPDRLFKVCLACYLEILEEEHNEEHHHED